MHHIIRYMGSSIGKKLWMALTGFIFIGFLIGHLAGNLTVFRGAETFLNYAARLHELGLLLKAVEYFLVLCACTHIVTGVWLFIRNQMARPVSYVVNRSGGGRTLGSRTMPYTGIYILLFVIFHLATVSFVGQTQMNVYQIITAAFHNPLYVGYYLTAMVAVGLHVSHGVFSACQSLGMYHSAYTPLLLAGSKIIGLIFAMGFGSIPVFFAFMA